MITTHPSGSLATLGMTGVLAVLLSFSAIDMSSAAQDAASRKLSRSERKDRIKNLADQYRQFLAEVEPIMHPEELDAFLLLESDAQRDLYIDDFWRRRAATQRISVNEVRESYYDRLQTAKEKFRSVASDRGKIYIIQGPPVEVLASDTCRLLQPLEIWKYSYIPDLGHSVRFIFYIPRQGVDYRLWQPVQNSLEAMAELISADIMTTSLSDATAIDQGTVKTATEKVFGPCYRFATMTHVECECLHGDEIMRAIAECQVARSDLQKVFNPPPVNKEDVRKILHAVVISNPNATRLSADFSIAFPAQHGSRTDAQMTILVPRSQLTLKEVAGLKLYSLDVTGEVMKDDQLFENYRYRFDYPAGVVSDQVAVVIDRFLPPAEYRSRIKVADLNSNSEAIVEKAISVPELTAEQPKPSAGNLASSEMNLRIVPLSDALLSGVQHVETITSGNDIRAVEFYLDGNKIMTKRTPPFTLDLDLGEVPQARHIRAIALNGKGEFIGGDEVVVNAGNDPFRVRIVSPRVAMKAHGRTRVEMAVTIPEGKALDKLELYLNETRMATLYGPPYVQTIDLPSRAAVTYLHVVATLKDSDQPPVEDVVMINTPQYMEEVNVHLVELPTTVIRDGHPVNDLSQSAFKVLDEGKPVKISKFEHVTNLPLSVGLAIDTSASMQPRIAEAQKAAAQFFATVMKKGDKAFLVSFDSQPHVVQHWSPTLADVNAGLAKLRTDESTALYDAVVYSLYNFVSAKGQKALVVVTDGKDTSSKFSFDQALEYARRAAVPIYGIGIGISQTEVDVRYKLGKFCTETGGNVYYVDQASDLQRIYEDVQNELRSQYILGFYPAEGVKPGSKWHGVSVQVSEGKAKTIRGYYP